MAASSLEQKLSRLEAKLKQENREARRKIDLNLEISPARARPIIVITLSPAPAPSQRAALQLPLANDGSSRSSSSENSPQHQTHQPRPRHMLGLPQPSFPIPRSMESIEIDQKLQEIMKQTGYLTIGGQRYQAEINDLENLGEIGSGTCGQVWKMRFKKTGHIIAVKQMRRSGNKEENKRILMDLDVVLKSHDCPYIVQCFGTFITNTDVFIAMELMGTCAEKLKKRIQGPIPERILGKMTVAIVKALYYLKEKHGVIHRDVKPSNILLDERGQIKLCDFGISGRLVDSKAKTRSAGCAAYMAPERIDPPDPTKPDYDIRADVWSLGISLVELATGQFPYKNCKTDFEVLTKVLQEDPPLLPNNMSFSVDFQSFVKDWNTTSSSVTRHWKWTWRLGSKTSWPRQSRPARAASSASTTCLSSPGSNESSQSKGTRWPWISKPQEPTASWTDIKEPRSLCILCPQPPGTQESWLPEPPTTSKPLCCSAINAAVRTSSPIPPSDRGAPHTGTTRDGGSLEPNPAAAAAAAVGPVGSRLALGPVPAQPAVHSPPCAGLLGADPRRLGLRQPGALSLGPGGACACPTGASGEDGSQTGEPRTGPSSPWQSPHLRAQLPGARGLEPPNGPGVPGVQSLGPWGCHCH
ncbi:dual specificity mitogen-activated protein kinase kinase 7 isoform X2 [Chrysemys picta bellii]|uniref:dual specificity mitogen-activated protein kinase kinase 7 isoform X2 n=1 Tax=Chrysemys picta bellii TaxID=8478 RepID=UPI0032B22C47